jgi:hypothetical protein
VNHSDAGGRVRWTLRAHEGGSRTARTAARRKAGTVAKTTNEAEDAWRPRPRGVDPGSARDRMSGAVTTFVDDPRGAVAEADALASEVADALVAEIESRREALRAAWDEGADTETLRLALRSYRSFVQSLITAR